MLLLMPEDQSIIENFKMHHQKKEKKILEKVILTTYSGINDLCKCINSSVDLLKWTKVSECNVLSTTIV